jgi:predicted MFS family arabinose efflux permease
MDNAVSSLRRQWCQLLALTFAHAVADTYVGIVAPVLVPLMTRYDVPLSRLIFVSTLLAFAANALQLLIGHLRSTWSSPRLISLGVLLSGTAVFLTVLPVNAQSVTWMSVLALTAGFGVAAVHPEGLRAVHGLNKISSSLTTAVFMVSGFLGFAGGALLSTTMTEHFGLTSLVWLYALAPVAALALHVCGLRLPIETEKNEQTAATDEHIPKLPFVPLFAMAALLATSSQIQATLLPTYLHKDVGFSLSFSGLSFTLFGIGGMIGAITWGALAPRIGYLRVVFLSTLLGAPLTLLYLLLAPHSRWAAVLFIFTAFIVYTGFPLCITLARYADSKLRFGQRMGLISGGTWGIAAVVLWILAPLTESPRVGMGPLLHLVWIGYLIAAAIALRLSRKKG